jgi:hypothetical protein
MQSLALPSYSPGLLARGATRIHGDPLVNFVIRSGNRDEGFRSLSSRLCRRPRSASPLPGAGLYW